MLQLGTSSGFESSGYISTIQAGSPNATITNGFQLTINNSSAHLCSGSETINLTQQIINGEIELEPINLTHQFINEQIRPMNEEIINSYLQNGDEFIETCSICLDDVVNIESISKLSCGHHFHTKCIRLCLERNVKCPLCRQYCLIIN